MQKHISSLQNYVQANNSNVAPMQKHRNNTSKLSKVILRTRGTFRWGFPDIPLGYGCYTQAVIVFQWFFLQPTKRASLYYFRGICAMWFLPHLFCCHDLFTFLFTIFSSYRVHLLIARETAINNGLKFCMRRDLYADQ